MDRQSELNIERAAEHIQRAAQSIRTASQCMDKVAMLDPTICARLEALDPRELAQSSTADCLSDMADRLMALLDETPIDARQAAE